MSNKKSWALGGDRFTIGHFHCQILASHIATSSALQGVVCQCLAVKMASNIVAASALRSASGAKLGKDHLHISPSLSAPLLVNFSNGA
jgi:hypothetical protein